MSRYIPFPANPNDAPFDISFIFEDEKPAGKHGFLKADGERFVFEDGTVARFWGTNVNSGHNFPDYDYAEKFAKRLAKIGCNIVRLHQLDAEWATPNIFQFTKGPHQKNTQSFDPESMRRLDYLIYCLKEEGIYTYMDMYTYRKFKTGDGVENAFILKDGAKPYNYFAPRIVELQKQLARDLWNHVNEFTGVAYKDEPAIVMAEIVNESDFSIYKIDIEPYVTIYRDLLADWVKETGAELDPYTCNINDFDDPVQAAFRVKLQEDHYIDMMNCLREIGVKIPICGTNWAVTNEQRKPNNVCDFNDSHFYFYDWRWNPGDQRFLNTALTQAPDGFLHHMAAARSFGRPMFCSEWDMPWPNEYRAESPVLFAAAGLLQGWSGFAIHTYAYSSHLENMKMLGKEISAESIGGTAYREGIFSTWNDPAKFGLFYHAALMTRRGDVKESPNTTAMKALTMNTCPFDELAAVSEYTKIGMEYDEGPSTADRVIDEKTALVDLSKKEVRSDTGELYRNWDKNYGTIDTPRSKCIYGFLEKNGKIEIDGLSVRGKTDFAVVALSSLSDEPLDQCDNILLTTVGRAKNTDAKFDGDLMLEYGTAPITVEVIEADIELRTSCPTMKVWAVSAEGFYIGALPTTYEDGILRFTVGKSFPTMYYHIREE